MTPRKAGCRERSAAAAAAAATLAAIVLLGGVIDTAHAGHCAAYDSDGNAYIFSRDFGDYSLGTNVTDPASWTSLTGKQGRPDFSGNSTQCFTVSIHNWSYVHAEHFASYAESLLPQFFFLAIDHLRRSTLIVRAPPPINFDSLTTERMRALQNQFTDGLYVLGGDAANPDDAYIFNFQSQSWSTQQTTGGPGGDFVAILVRSKPANREPQPDPFLAIWADVVVDSPKKK